MPNQIHSAARQQSSTQSLNAEAEEQGVLRKTLWAQMNHQRSVFWPIHPSQPLLMLISFLLQQLLPSSNTSFAPVIFIMAARGFLNATHYNNLLPRMDFYTGTVPLSLCFFRSLSDFYLLLFSYFLLIFSVLSECCFSSFVELLLETTWRKTFLSCEKRFKALRSGGQIFEREN